MIEEFTINNFKSFGPNMAPLTLSPLNFVVGANASGKTNLLSALRFLKTAIMQSVEVAANEYGGASEIQNKVIRPTKDGVRVREKPKLLQIELSVTPRRRPFARTKNGDSYRIGRYEYGVEIDLGSSDEPPGVALETMKAQVLFKDGSEATFIMDRDRDKAVVSDPTADPKRTIFRISEGDEASLFAGSNFVSPVLAWFRRDVERWSFFNIDPNTARQASKDVVDPELGESGEFLSTILHRMEKEKGEEFSNLVDALRGAIPAFKGVRSRQVEADGKRTFQMIEDRLKGGINPRAISDGSIRLLALTVIVYWSAQRSSLVCIEEPETGLHPHLARSIIEVLRIAVEDTQILATTHNPDFLDQLKAEEIILCDKVNGITRVKHAADVKDIAAFRKHYSLGELWEQGKLGAIP